MLVVERVELEAGSLQAPVMTGDAVLLGELADRAGLRE
jgi:hypothetical protein